MLDYGKLKKSIEDIMDDGYAKHIPLTSDFLASRLVKAEPDIQKDEPAENNDTAYEIMTKEEREALNTGIRRVLGNAVSDEYLYMFDNTVNSNNDTLMTKIADDVIESSNWKYTKFYNDDDIKLAIGRTLYDLLDIYMMGQMREKS